MVVVVDGDSAGLKQRLKELDQRLIDEGGARRDAKEKIAACIPCRTVETWEMWLCGRRDLNEAHGYKADWQTEKRKGTMDAQKAGRAWFDQLSEAAAKAEEDQLPSLAAGRAELNRLYTLADRG
jgi:hypothetical protein